MSLPPNSSSRSLGESYGRSGAKTKVDHDRGGRRRGLQPPYEPRWGGDTRAPYREVLEPAIDAHGGTLIKRTGDGLLAEFASVVEALRCAVEIQQGATERNQGLSPDRHIALRIGVNLGDIIVEPHDIFGDG